MHCYKIIIIIITIKLQKLKSPIRLFLSDSTFDYRILLIQLLREFCSPQRFENKQKLVKFHSLTSKLSTIKNHVM